MREKKKNKQWEKLKNSLFAVQKEFEERNGRDYCKNCGMNFIFLVGEIERIFLTPQPLTSKNMREEIKLC